MATLKTISVRLKSVKNIQKITKSMKMVSAAKYSRAERELKQARPLGEGCQIFFEKIDITKSTIETHSDKQNLIIAISSDRGLCGAVHNQVSKAVKAEVKSYPEPTQIVCVGDKSRALLQSALSDNIVLVVNDIGRLPPNFLDASEIALYTNQYNFTFGKIIYNKFLSVVSYRISKINFFTENAVRNAPKSSVYNSLDSDVLNSYLEFSFVTMLFYTLKENACSELASRMSAMDNASKNAGDMISLLTLSFNRTRQAAITRELTEIISGASALN